MSPDGRQKQLEMDIRKRAIRAANDTFHDENEKAEEEHDRVSDKFNCIEANCALKKAEESSKTGRYSADYTGDCSEPAHPP